MQACPLCAEDGGLIVLRNDLFRVVLVDDPELPGFTRVIVNAHAKEMTDLEPVARVQLLRAVLAVEEVQREVLGPVKMNLASLGNAVPHVHWHVIPRFADDAFYPQPIWGTRQRETPPAVLAARHALLPVLRQRLVEQIGDLGR
ncbi:MAG TPA: HIT family protein [Burkholderiaceae bacterium]|jgi:diadenosine tetraphosphate (Ap4A) HIT family hydrolase|nr:HIT family protein [Burkholderiaceae bacterium]